MAVSVRGQRGQRVVSPFANVIAGALVAPTGLPGSVLGIGIPVSLSNGGTGVSASSNAQLLDEIGAVPRAGGSMSGNLTVSGGILVGEATPGLPETGTIHIQRNTVLPPTLPGIVSALHVIGADGEPITMDFDGFSGTGATAANSPVNLMIRCARGGAATREAHQINDGLGIISWRGYSDDPDYTGAVANLQARVSQPAGFGPGGWGTQLEFRTVPNNTTGLALQMTVGPGITVGAPTAQPTGGMAVGAINAQAIYINGDPVGTGGGLSTSGGTVNGLVTINGGANSTPLTVQTNSGVPAEIRFDNATAYQWSVGPGGAGVFRIAEYSGVVPGAPARITIDGATGEVGIEHNLAVDGDLNVVGDIVGGTVTPSDRRLKKNIKPWSCGLEAVKRLKPISYEYNGRGGLLADGRIRVGLDASATQKVIPEMVKNSSRDIGGKPLKMIHSDTVTYALINAVTELANRLEALERR